VVLTLLSVALAAGCDEGSGDADATRHVGRLSGEDAEVFLDLSASPKQIADVEKAIRRSGVVDRFAYLDREEAVREFRRLFPNESKTLATRVSGELPPSFRVIFRDANGLQELRRSLRGMGGYDGVVDRTHPGRLEAHALGEACQALVLSEAVDVDSEVFMNVLATPEQQDQVRTRLEQAPEVRRITFLSKDDAYRVFRRLFADKPKLLRDTTPEILPTSFRVWFRSGADPSRLLSELQTDLGLGVDEVKTADPMVRDFCRGA
jgi:cell division protein FtsX